MNEIWRDIPDYEGRYQISNLGRVKSLQDTRGNHREKILKQWKHIYGYLYVDLHKKGKKKSYRVHRLVVETFMGKPLDKDYYSINHIDENKENNKLENLQYCTHQYNNNYGSHNERMSKTLSKRVIGINKISGYICEFNSVTEAGRTTGIDKSSISRCCKGKQKSAGGYRWIYKYEEVEK